MNRRSLSWTVSVSLILASCARHVDLPRSSSTSGPNQVAASPTPTTTIAAMSVTGADVVILGSSVTGGAASAEAQAVSALGMTFNVVSDAQWAAMTTADFAAYKAMVIGDPYCSTVSPSAAVNNAETWGAAANGNVFIIGSDPTYHWKTNLIQSAISFAASTPGKTGAYITLSCNFHDAAPESVPMLAGLSQPSLGSFTASGAPGCFNDAYLTASSPALLGISSTDLSNWSCSVHEIFTSWPSDFEVLAIARNAGAAYTAPDGTIGTPYILARGNVAVVSDIALTADTSSHVIGTPATLTANVTSGGLPLSGSTVTFTVIDGPSTGITGTAVTDATGKATFTYSATVPGTDGLRATFTDASGHTQSSSRVTVDWTVAGNGAPTAPGQPVLNTSSLSPNATGKHTMRWTPATDPDGDTLTYLLQHKNAQAADYSSAHSGVLNALELSLDEAEGTWTYRVRASDGTLDGDFSVPSTPVVVDKTAPTSPAAQINGSPAQSTWYRDTATLTFSGSSDPTLADGSAGSGVNTYQGTQTITTSGVHPYSGTATDQAGNTSAPTTGTLRVDATSPTLTLNCPAQVTLGSVATASWTASDAHAGLTGPGSGTLTLNTTSVGSKTASVTASDAVGHEVTRTCTYAVMYAAWNFQQPVDVWPTLNVAKAGSTVPVKFSLKGNQGLNILAGGYPKVTPVACTGGTILDDIEEILADSVTGLRYDATSDTYIYAWKTGKSMIGCWQLTMRLNDGSERSAAFQLK